MVDKKKPAAKKPPAKKPKDGPVRTQMVGEAPGEDLGYDPGIIPTEEIVDDDDDDDFDR
jgi:hypothetical protein